jgi:polyisoprenoid-binding protein YceI
MALLRAALLGLSLGLSLSACQHSLQSRPGGGRPAPPAAPPAAAPGAEAAAVRYRLDADRSEVLILVYRDGPMAALGHNHVIAVRQLSGELMVDGNGDSRFWIDFPVAALSVDEPALRAAQGPDFETTVGAAAIAGTRDHMLGEQLLDATHYPIIHLQSVSVRAQADTSLAVTSVAVRAHSAQLEVPVLVQRSAQQLSASGEFDVTHAELGLSPYSVALGALRVAERMHVRYRLLAARVSEPSAARGQQ